MASNTASRFDYDIARFTPRQLEVCRAIDEKAKYILYGGALGGGKSYLLRWLAVRILMTIAYKYGIRKACVMLACEDYPTLKDRQISKISTEFPPWLGTYHDDHKIYGKCFILDDRDGGGIICLRNLDDPSKYQSAEFVAILVDELTKNDLSVFTDLRMRLRWKGVSDEDCVFVGGTNPGGIGHNYCKAYWVNKTYPPEFCAPIDYRPKFRYIPSKAEDNPHLDDAYWNMLQTLPEHLRAAFRDGSWDIFQGQAFTFMRETHVIKPIPIQRHAHIYMTFDWGFGAPFSIGWWWVDGDGRGYRFAEFYGWNGTPNQGLRWEDSRIADEIVKKELELSAQYQIDFKTALRLAGPDCFQKKPDYKGGGQGPSTAETFATRGIYLTHGDPTRAVKIRQFRERLKVPYDQDGKQIGLPMILIYETCDQFIRTIPDIIVAKNDPEEVDTNGEDHCLSGNTMVVTDKGEMRIADMVGTQGTVLTVNGEWTQYRGCRKTRINADVIRILFSNGRSVVCTEDHKFLLNNNTWVCGKDLTDEQCHVSMSVIKPRRKRSWMSLLSAILFKSSTTKDIGYVENTFSERAKGSTGQYGNITMEASPMVMKSTIKMLTGAITRLTILWRRLIQFTYLTMLSLMTNRYGLMLCTVELPSGTEARMVGSGTKNNTRNIARERLIKQLKRHVSFVVSNIKGKNIQHIAPGSANNEPGQLMTGKKSVFALSVLGLLSQTADKIKRPAQRVARLNLHGESVKPLKVERIGKEDVYCLDVDHASHAFAVCGGILVHNCYDEACHFCMARPIALRIPDRLKTSAQAHIDMIEKPIPRDQHQMAVHDMLVQSEMEADREIYNQIYTPQQQPQGGTYSDIDDGR